ncbi:ParB N-terminal domain-containing protein [Candidatus Poribacteria bacterium]|nr:ParB N-terminal domain-containing protein [Candidatus Poribacteria bacterium]
MELELGQLDLRYQATRVRDEARRSRLMSSLIEHGQQSAVLVVADGAERYVLIDGYARVEALAALGRDLVEVSVLDLPEAEALILAHRLEGTHRRSAIEEGWLIVELLERHGLSQREVAQRLRRSVSWVSRRVGLVQGLPASVEKALRRGTVAPHAAAKFLLPLARANTEHCEKLVSGLGSERLSVREVERLYAGWKCASPTTRESIVEKPILFLRAEASTQPDDALPNGDPAAPLFNDLHGITGLARRAQRRVDEGLLRELDTGRRGKITNAATQARLATEAMIESLSEGCEL